MANMTFKTNLLPNSTRKEYSLGSSTQPWQINGVSNPSLINFYGTCTTAAGTVQKDVTLIDNADMFALETGVIVRVKITNANSATNPTLKVGSTDAKPIMRFGTTTASTTANSSWESDSIITFIYDGTNWLMADFALRRNDNTIPSAYCSTAATTAAKVASCSGYTLLSKSYIHIIITTSNSVQGALTMNINSKGAKPIYINGTASSASNYTLPAGSYLVYYDGTNYYFRTDGKLTANITGSASAVAWSGVTSKPTTISGYGITDAKIDNGVITLGSNTITPLSASSTLDATKLSGTIPTSCYTDTNNAVTQTATSTNADYEVLFSVTADNTTRTEGARKNSNLKFNPSTGNLTVTKINGVEVGSTPKFTDTITTVTTSGSGNAITAISASNGAITATKGTTFLTSHQDISGKVDKSGDTMTGPLYINVTTDTSGTTDTGPLVIGNKAGENIAIDSNEIMARKNKVASILHINHDGGLVQIGSGGLKVTGSTTMTEDLSVSGKYVNVISTNIDNSTTPTSNTFGNAVVSLQSNDGVHIGYLQPYKFSNGTSGLRIAARLNDDGTNYTNILSLGVKADHTDYVSVSSPDVWCSALGAVKKSGDTMTGALSAPSIYGTQTAGEGQVGIKYNGGSLYFWGNNTSGTAGLYDSNGTYILQRNSSTNKYKIYGEQLIIDTGTNPDGNTSGHGVKIWHDSEGGNIGIYAGKTNQTDNYYYEIDAPNGNLRVVALKNGSYLSTPCYISPTQGLFGAVWNDYAEFRKDNEKEKDIQQPGKCIKENGDGTLSLTTRRLERGCEIISDTFGFSIGQDKENGCNTPIASSGRVLAYPYESIEEFANHIGWPVCSGPDGTVSIMTEEEEEKYPSRIIGTISEIPSYEEWGTGKVKVNGRIWIRIK